MQRGVCKSNMWQGSLEGLWINMRHNLSGILPAAFYDPVTAETEQEKLQSGAKMAHSINDYLIWPAWLASCV